MSISHELGHGVVQNPSLYALAEEMCDRPDGFDRYNYAKCVWLGNPDRNERLSGQHPWPTRVKDGKEYVYSVPVMAGVDVAHRRILYVGKDDWQPDDDPNAWIVAERGLLDGEETERRVLGSSVDASNRLRLHIAPASYGNFPPTMQYAMRHRPPYDQIALIGRLDERYNISESVIREGRDGTNLAFEDIESLESMIIMVQQLRRQAEQIDEVLEGLDMVHTIGNRSIMAMAYAA